MMHPFQTYIQQFTPLLEADWHLIEASLTLREYTKNDIIQSPDRVCRKLFFLETGLLRYYTPRDGEEVTKFFTVAPYCFTVQQSLTNETPSPDGIMAIEDSRVWELNKDVAFDLFRLPSWNTFIRKLIQEVQFNTEQILQELQSDTAEIRYRRMLAEQQDLLSRIPLKYLASFLGIAPQSLSRIRKRCSVENKS